MTNVRLINAYIIAIDLVGYSKLRPVEKQVSAIEELNEVVISSIRWLGLSSNEVVYLPTGDGMFIGFPSSIDITAPFKFARRLHTHHYQRDKRVQLKIAVREGVVFSIKDINGNNNFAGSGINLAARLETCCSPGHILVDSQIVLKLIENWSQESQEREVGSAFHGSVQFKFRVKWNEEFYAFNYCGSDFGNSDEPTNNRAWDGTYTRLVERLGSCGIGPTGVLAEHAMRKAYENRLIIGESVVEHFAHYRGVTADRIKVATIGSMDPILPEFILDKRKGIDVNPNNPKVHLVTLQRPTVDNDDRLMLTVGSSDYRTSMAIYGNERSIIERFDGLPDRFPGRLNLDVVVITADNKMILVKRSDSTDYYPGMWAVLGETLDGKKDLDETGTPSPLKAAHRALREHDETNLAGILSENEVEFHFLAAVTQCRYLLKDLIVLAKLHNITADQVRDHIGAESTYVDAIDFSVSSCLQVIKAKRHMVPGVNGSDAEFADFAIASILAALFHKFGYAAVVRQI